MIIAAVIFAVLLTAAVLLFFFLHPQKALLPGEFSSQMREMGYTVSETSGQYGTDGAAEMYEAVRDSCRVEYINAASEEDAEEFFSGIRSAWEQERGTPGSSTASSGLHGETYARTSDGEYRAVSRIGNTVVTGSSPEAGREEMKESDERIGVLIPQMLRDSGSFSRISQLFFVLYFSFLFYDSLRFTVFCVTPRRRF